MIDKFYLHLELENKKCKWSINLPFLCIKCGVCCKLEDFLSAGEITAKPEEQPQVHTKVKDLFETLGKTWEANEEKYDKHIALAPCPFLVNNTCSIYEIRPLGCQLFPKTAFGMQTKDCPSLTRFKKQRSALKKGKTCKESYYFVDKTSDSTKYGKSIKSSGFTEKRYHSGVARLRQAGITEDELVLFNEFNGKKQKPKSVKA